jgi:hypothetical protein
MRWLDTVSFKDLHPAMVLAVLRIDSIVARSAWGGDGAIITSGNDSVHKEGSKHYEGKALDFRTHNWPASTKQQVFRDVKAALGPTFFVDLEDSGLPNEHLHVQFNEG